MIDFNKLPKELKNLLIHSLIFPFWYISIYIFNKELYKTDDTLLLIFTSLCLTIASSFVASLVVHIISKESKAIFEPLIIYSSAIIQITWFSILLIISYISKKEFNSEFEFYGFVLAYFIPLILIYILGSNLNEIEKGKGEEG